MDQNGVTEMLHDKQLCVMIVAPLRPGCGNNTTAARLRHYLESHSILCKMCGSDEFTHQKAFISHIVEEKVTTIIALHALHSGKWIYQLDDIPYILIFGGTDLNEYSKDSKHLQTMTKVTQKASYLVCFSQQMRDKALSIWPWIDPSKLAEIPQGNRICIAPKSGPARVSISEGLREKYGLEEDAIIFTLVAGIRPVKDPIFLLKHFSEWHVNVNPKCYLIIAGPVIDQTYHESFLELVSTYPGLIYLGVLSTNDAHRLMRDSFAVVNSSLSEGMCVAILEAMELGVPVIARNIPGNQSIIHHGNTGMLYDTPQEFIECANTILTDSSLYSRLCNTGQKYVQNKHNRDNERQAYISLVQKLADKRRESLCNHHQACNNNTTNYDLSEEGMR